MVLLICVSLSAYGIIAFLRPDWGVYGILALLPVYQVRFNVFGYPSTALEWMIILSAAGMGIRLLLGEPSYRKRVRIIFHDSPWLLVWIGLFILSGIVSVAVSPETLKALGIFKAYFAEGLLFWLVAYLALDSPKKQLYSFYALFILLLGLSFFGLYQFLTLYHLPPAWWGPGTEPRRVVSLYSYPNAVALLIAPILTILSGLIIFRKHLAAGRSKGFLFFTLFCGTALLGLTFSRGGWLGFCIGLLLLGWLSRYRKMMIAVVLVIISTLLIVPASRDRILPALGGNDPAGQERLKLYRVAVDVLKEEPVLGAGLMGFREWYGAFKPGLKDDILNYPHNIFLNFWLESGLFGLLAILGMLVWIVNRSKKMIGWGQGYGQFTVIILAALTSLVVHGLVDAPFFKNDLAILFWYLLSLFPAASASKIGQSELERETQKTAAVGTSANGPS